MVTLAREFGKQHLIWYLITMKLRETVESGIVKSPTSTRPLKLSEQPQQQVQKQQHHPLFEAQQIFIEPNGEDQEIRGGGGASDVSDWVISIKQNLDGARQDDVTRLWSKLSIYKVPHYLREGDDKAYVPQIVSLGPYHRSNKRLRQIDRHKWRSLQHFLKRKNQDIELYLDSIRELEVRARACYEGSINMCSDEFVEMMVLDGCFVLELFRGATEGPEGFKQLGYGRKDPVFSIRGSMHSIQRDMIMLENQIPLFILDRLLGLQLGCPNQKGLVAKLAERFFDPLMPTPEPVKKSDQNKLEYFLELSIAFDPLSDHGGLHCLDVFRRSLLRTGPEPAPRIGNKGLSDANRIADKRRLQLIHCATELRDAGVKFRKRKTDRFWDIKFKNGVLKIPRLLIHDGTKSLFLNLIAFEQCHLGCTNNISSYAIFMDNLINSSKDVGYLHDCGIIEHWLGSNDEVASLFNHLCREVVFDINDSYLSTLSGDVNNYCKYRWNTWRTVLQQKYLSNPWAIISVIAAVILLLLTLAQTFYAAYGYHRPS